MSYMFLTSHIGVSVLMLRVVFNENLLSKYSVASVQVQYGYMIITS